jgi:hypothetical protein
MHVLGYQPADKGVLGGGKAEGEGGLFAQEQFRQAVQEARVKLVDSSGRPDRHAQEILLGEGAVRIVSGGYENVGPIQVAQPDIPEQIMTGLSQNLRAGAGEFVIKLVPEGLGEITVRLLMSEAGTTLRIITASAQTARLINSDIAALQSALRPIHVEVLEAVPETAQGGEAGAYYPGYDQFNQYSSRHGQGQSHGQGEHDEAQDDGLLAMQAAIALPEQDLDVYV